MRIHFKKCKSGVAFRDKASPESTLKGYFRTTQAVKKA